MSQVNSILGSKRKAYESVVSIRWEEIKKTCEWYVEQNLDSFIPAENKETRESNPQINLDSSCWGQMLNDPTLNIPDSMAAKRFRRRFRVPPFIFFHVLIPLCAEGKIFKVKSEAGRRLIPIKYKLLVALRMLGRGSVADDCFEMSGIPESTCNKIFHQFVLNFCQRYFHRFITFPRKLDELLKMMEVYRRLGLPGCIGSIDVTHVHWDKCAKE
jgi:hypothetical protein